MTNATKYLALLGLILFISSCVCDATEHTIETIGSITANETVAPFDGPDEIISTEFLINFIYHPFPSVGDCDFDLTNPVDNGSVSLVLDKAITFDGTEILANTNILDLDGVTTDITNEGGTIFFSLVFIEKAEFERENHLFDISMKTSNNVDLLASIELFMDL